jgi:hypothetical protein
MPPRDVAVEIKIPPVAGGFEFDGNELSRVVKERKRSRRKVTLL